MTFNDINEITIPYITGYFKIRDTEIVNVFGTVIPSPYKFTYLNDDMKLVNIYKDFLFYKTLAISPLYNARYFLKEWEGTVNNEWNPNGIIINAIEDPSYKVIPNYSTYAVNKNGDVLHRKNKKYFKYIKKINLISDKGEVKNNTIEDLLRMVFE